MSRWKKVEVKLLKNVFIYILIVNRTKVVESLDVLQGLASFWTEIIRNTNNCQMNVIVFWCLIYELETSTDAVISNVCKHNDSILCVWNMIFLNEIFE